MTVGQITLNEFKNWVKSNPFFMSLQKYNIGNDILRNMIQNALNSTPNIARSLKIAVFIKNRKNELKRKKITQRQYDSSKQNIIRSYKHDMRQNIRDYIEELEKDFNKNESLN